MLIDFYAIKESTTPGMNNGKGSMTAKMYVDMQKKLILCSLHPGGTIGAHRHKSSEDISFILSGTGKAICSGQEEKLLPGCCHICPRGSEHSIMNTGKEDLVMLTVVVER